MRRCMHLFLNHFPFCSCACTLSPSPISFLSVYLCGPQDAIKNDKAVKKTLSIVNVDRSALARVSGAIAKQHGNSGFLGSLQLTLQGSAGQSFACFNIQVCAYKRMCVDDCVQAYEHACIRMDEPGWTVHACVEKKTCMCLSASTHTCTCAKFRRIMRV